LNDIEYKDWSSPTYQGVIGSKTELGAEGGVTTALGVATSQTDSGAFASDNDEALGRCLVGFLQIHADMR
jgi:hypothetical protein